MRHVHLFQSKVCIECIQLSTFKFLYPVFSLRTAGQCFYLVPSPPITFVLSPLPAETYTNFEKWSKWSNTVDISINRVFVTTAHSDSSVLMRCHKQCAQEINSNTNVSTFCVAKGPTVHSGKCGLPQGATTNLHVMSASNCKLHINRLNLFKNIHAICFSN